MSVDPFPKSDFGEVETTSNTPSYSQRRIATDRDQVSSRIKIFDDNHEQVLRYTVATSFPHKSTVVYKLIKYNALMKNQ